jgi:hypothetical protein
MTDPQIELLIARIRKATDVERIYDDVIAYSKLTCDKDGAESWQAFTTLRLHRGYQWRLGRELPVRFLRLGDTVRTGHETDGFAVAAVVQVTTEEVGFFCSYVTTGDFSYAGGVIPYIGVQQWKAYRSTSASMFVYCRKELA